MQSVFGGNLSWSNASEQNIVSLNNNGNGFRCEVHIRANNAGIEFGGPELVWPSTQHAFELTPGHNYVFHLVAAPGSSQENTAYLRNYNGGSNSVDYLILFDN